MTRVLSGVALALMRAVVWFAPAWLFLLIAEAAASCCLSASIATLASALGAVRSRRAGGDRGAALTLRVVRALASAGDESGSRSTSC